MERNKNHTRIKEKPFPAFCPEGSFYDKEELPSTGVIASGSLSGWYETLECLRFSYYFLWVREKYSLIADFF